MSTSPASGGFPGLRHPLAAQFLAFCLLPTTGLHATRVEAAMPAAMQGHNLDSSRAHRYWSDFLRADAALDVDVRIDDPALPLAMLPAESLERFRLTAGAVLAGPQIRRCIARTEVLTLREQLGNELFTFVRQRAQTLHPGLDPLPCWSAGNARDTLKPWGDRLLSRAFAAASPAVGRRGLLHLPVLDGDEHNLPLNSGEALALCLSVLQEIDSKWLSLFRATR